MNKINIILLALILIFLILRIILLKISKKYILKKQNIESNSYYNYLKKTIQAQKFIKSNTQFSMRGEDSNRYDSYYNKKNIKNNNNKSVFKKFNKILDLDLKNMTIDVESGVTWDLSLIIFSVKININKNVNNTVIWSVVLFREFILIYTVFSVGCRVWMCYK